MSRSSGGTDGTGTGTGKRDSGRYRLGIIGDLQDRNRSEPAPAQKWPKAHPGTGTGTGLVPTVRYSVLHFALFRFRFQPRNQVMHNSHIETYIVLASEVNVIVIDGLRQRQQPLIKVRPEGVISLSASSCASLSARQARQTTPPLLAFAVAMLLDIPLRRHFSEFAVKEDMLCMLYYVLDNVYTLAWLAYSDYSHQIWSAYDPPLFSKQKTNSDCTRSSWNKRGIKTKEHCQVEIKLEPR
ncbi:hypothetical protein LXL04_038110 [Taraxacum kok-saghyz]